MDGIKMKDNNENTATNVALDKPNTFESDVQSESPQDNPSSVSANNFSSSTKDQNAKPPAIRKVMPLRAYVRRTVSPTSVAQSNGDTQSAPFNPTPVPDSSSPSSNGVGYHRPVGKAISLSDMLEKVSSSQTPAHPLQGSHESFNAIPAFPTPSQKVFKEFKPEKIPAPVEQEEIVPHHKVEILLPPNSGTSESFDIRSALSKLHDQQQSDPALTARILQHPSMIVRYNVSKIRSSRKQELLTQQELLRSSSPYSSSQSHSSGSSTWSTSSSTGQAQGATTPASSSGRRKFQTSPSERQPFATSAPRRSGSGRGGRYGGGAGSYRNSDEREMDEISRNRQNSIDRLNKKHQQQRGLREPETPEVKCIVLPSVGDIDLSELCELAGVRMDNILRYVTSQLGVAVHEDKLVDSGVAAAVLQWLKDDNDVAIDFTIENVAVVDDRATATMDVAQPQSQQAPFSSADSLLTQLATQSATPTLPAPVSDSPLPTSSSLLARDGIALLSTNSATTAAAKKNRISLLSRAKKEGSNSGVPRSPVVSIMGHVDHGKTTLLDRIRNTDVCSTEAGGITQRVSAFSVNVRAEGLLGNGTLQDHTITFLDTPGHAIFSSMRARGANLTDIVVLVIAADDGVMEQTRECLAAAKAANCAIILAINKIDLNVTKEHITKIYTDLTAHDILVENLGGSVQCALISGSTGIGISELLEKIVIESEVMELRAAVDSPVSGRVLDGGVDKRHGVMGTVILQQGTLRVGDIMVAGNVIGKVRRILDDRGNLLKSATPSIPVRVTGFNEIPKSGDLLTVVENEATAKRLAEARNTLNVRSDYLGQEATLLNAGRGLLLQSDGGDATGQSNEVTKVPLVIKADSTSSIEALTSAINAIRPRVDSSSGGGADRKVFDIVHSGVGDITSADIALVEPTSASKAGAVVGFQLNPLSHSLLGQSKNKDVKVVLSKVIYHLVQDLTDLLSQSDAPPLPGGCTFLGRAEVLKVFTVGKTGKVAGSVVKEGMFVLPAQQPSGGVPSKGGDGTSEGAEGEGRQIRVRVVRNRKEVVHTGPLSSLRVEKKAVAEVMAGDECGIAIDKFADFQEGDVLECFELAPQKAATEQ